LKSKDIPTKLLARYEYKKMLKSIQSNLELLDNKQSVDTIFSLGKLHKHMSAAELQEKHPDFIKYFEYFVRDILSDSVQRIPELQSIHIAYLSKGLTDLRKVLTTLNSETELVLRESIK
jgi:hypothetical protein